VNLRKDHYHTDALHQPIPRELGVENSQTGEQFSVRLASAPFSPKFDTGTRRIGVRVKRKFLSKSECINPHSVKVFEIEHVYMCSGLDLTGSKRPLQGVCFIAIIQITSP